MEDPRPAIGTTLAILILLLPAAFSAGCRETDPPSRPADLPAFRLPSIDLSSLPEEMRSGAMEARKKAQASPDDPAAVGGLGMHYLAHALPVAAATCFQRAAALSPGSLRWQYLLGVAEMRAGRRKEAVDALERAVELDPAYDPARIRLADALLESDPERAGRLYREALARDARNPKAHLGLGRSYRLLGDPKKAEASTREALRIHPDYAEAHYALAMLLSAAGDKEGARSELRKHAAGTAPPPEGDRIMDEVNRIGAGSSFDLFDEATRLADAGRLDEAERLLRRALATDVSGSAARKQLGVVLGRQKRYAEAVTEFRIVVEQDPDDQEARTNLARALEGMGRADEAEQEYRLVLDRNPDQADARLYLGQLMARSGRAEAGLEHLARAVELQPGNGEAQYFLGVTLAQIGKAAESVAPLERAVQLMPEHVGAWFTLGQVQLMTGDPAGARRSWSRSVSLSPGFANGHANLARLAMAEGEPESAVASAEKACQASGFRNKEHLLVLAEAYEKAGRTSEAGETRRRAAGLR